MKIPFELSSHKKKYKNVIYGIEYKLYIEREGRCVCENKNKAKKNVKLIKCENLLLNHGLRLNKIQHHHTFVFINIR